MASSALQWELLKNNSAFMVKRNGQRFSTDPCNVTNQYTPTAMGLINKNGVGVTMGAALEKKSNLRHFTVSIKKNRRFASAIKRKNGKSSGETPLIQADYTITKGINRTAKFLQAQLKGSRLLTPALRKLKCLHESTKIKRKAINKSKRRVD